MKKATITASVLVATLVAVVWGIQRESVRQPFTGFVAGEDAPIMKLRCSDTDDVKLNFDKEKCTRNKNCPCRNDIIDYKGCTYSDGYCSTVDQDGGTGAFRCINGVASTPFLRHIARNEESCRFVA